LNNDIAELYVAIQTKKKKKRSLWKMNVKINIFQSILKIKKIGKIFTIMITEP